MAPAARMVLGPVVILCPSFVVRGCGDDDAAAAPQLVLLWLRASGRRSDLVGGHDPELADGAVTGSGDHVGDAVGDVFGVQDLGGGVEVVDLFPDGSGVV